MPPTSLFFAALAVLFGVAAILLGSNFAFERTATEPASAVIVAEHRPPPGGNELTKEHSGSSAEAPDVQMSNGRPVSHSPSAADEPVPNRKVTDATERPIVPPFDPYEPAGFSDPPHPGAATLAQLGSPLEAGNKPAQPEAAPEGPGLKTTVAENKPTPGGVGLNEAQRKETPQPVGSGSPKALARAPVAEVSGGRPAAASSLEAKEPVGGRDIADATERPIVPPSGPYEPPGLADPSRPGAGKLANLHPQQLEADKDEHQPVEPGRIGLRPIGERTGDSPRWDPEFGDKGQRQVQAPVSEDPRSLVIRASVGRRGVNRTEDVRLVQELLKDKAAARVGPVPVSGRVDARMIAAIEDFQRRVVKMKPDGRIDPGGRTFKALVADRQAAPPQDVAN